MHSTGWDHGERCRSTPSGRRGLREQLSWGLVRNEELDGYLAKHAPA